METVFSRRFDRELKKVLKKHPQYRTIIFHRLDILRESPYHPTLRFHKLTNRDEYAIAIDHDIRIIFSREKDICYLLTIGSHDEVY